MSVSRDEMERWVINARAAGVEIAMAEMDQILASGLAERVIWLRETLEAADWTRHPPDFLERIEEDGADE